MQPDITYSQVYSATATQMQAWGVDIFSLIGGLWGETSQPNFDGVLGFLDGVWLTYTIIAYLLCIVMLVLYAYASTGKNQLEAINDEMIARKEKIYEEKYRGGVKSDRLKDMFEHVATDNPSDWKLAIIEADIILDEILKEKGYAGISLGERLKSISPTQLQSLDDAWQAHKVRNQIAHGGADFVLTHKLAQDTIKQYRRVFNELGVR